jgi:hypothetical protein
MLVLSDQMHFQKTPETLNHTSAEYIIDDDRRYRIQKQSCGDMA